MTDVRTAGPADHAWIVATARELLGDEHQVHSRRQFGVLEGEVLLATDDGAPVGFLTWDHDAGAGEILALAVQETRRGVGRALVAAVRARAATAGVTRIVVVTTDENRGAQAFYAATGFTLAETRVGAVDDCRRRFKATIPAGIHDELEYVVDLDPPNPEEPC